MRSPAGFNTSSLSMQDNVESADSKVSAAAEIPRSAPKEPITIGSEDGREPPSVPEDVSESDGGWQEARTEEDPKQEVKTTFTRFRKKMQHPKGARSTGWWTGRGGPQQ